MELLLSPSVCPSSEHSSKEVRLLNQNVRPPNNPLPRPGQAPRTGPEGLPRPAAGREVLRNPNDAARLRSRRIVETQRQIDDAEDAIRAANAQLATLQDLAVVNSMNLNQYGQNAVLAQNTLGRSATNVWAGGGGVNRASLLAANMRGQNAMRMTAQTVERGQGIEQEMRAMQERRFLASRQLDRAEAELRDLRAEQARLDAGQPGGGLDDNGETVPGGLVGPNGGPNRIRRTNVDRTARRAEMLRAYPGLETGFRQFPEPLRSQILDGIAEIINDPEFENIGEDDMRVAMRAMDDFFLDLERSGVTPNQIEAVALNERPNDPALQAARDVWGRSANPLVRRLIQVIARIRRNGPNAMSEGSSAGNGEGMESASPAAKRMINANIKALKDATTQGAKDIAEGMLMFCGVNVEAGDLRATPARIVMLPQGQRFIGLIMGLAKIIQGILGKDKKKPIERTASIAGRIVTPDGRPMDRMTAPELTGEATRLELEIEGARGLGVIVNNTRAELRGINARIDGPPPLEGTARDEAIRNRDQVAARLVLEEANLARARDLMAQIQAQLARLNGGSGPEVISNPNVANALAALRNMLPAGNNVTVSMINNAIVLTGLAPAAANAMLATLAPLAVASNGMSGATLMPSGGVKVGVTNEAMANAGAMMTIADTIGRAVLNVMPRGTGTGIAQIFELPGTIVSGAQQLYNRLGSLTAAPAGPGVSTSPNPGSEVLAGGPSLVLTPAVLALIQPALPSGVTVTASGKRLVLNGFNADVAHAAQDALIAAIQDGNVLAGKIVNVDRSDGGLTLELSDTALASPDSTQEACRLVGSVIMMSSLPNTTPPPSIVVRTEVAGVPVSINNDSVNVGSVTIPTTLSGMGAALRGLVN